MDILFDDLAKRFADRDGGYTRIVRLAAVRLGDAGQQAIIEFVGVRDRVKSRKRTGPVVEAAAVTYSMNCVMPKCAAPKPIYFICNRPFIFLIHDKQYENVFYMGKYANPV